VNANVMKISAIVTVPPHATFLEEVASHPIVTGLRLNTVMPVKGGYRETLERLAALGRPLWVDLKGRQLRVVEAAVPPFTAVRVSHRVAVTTPADAFFSDGREYARVVEVDGDRLILEESPRRVVGPGESINIVARDLEIEGTLTPTDRAYLAAMREAKLSRVMLSYVESERDVAEVRELLPNAEVVLKIESLRGLDLVYRKGSSLGRLMAARGDLYIEVLEPHRIVAASRHIVAADPEAIAASRILTSLSRDPVPECADISDVAFQIALGYRTFKLGDDVCMRRDTVVAALNLLEAIAGEML
jgi:pyruvate kinase